MRTPLILVGASGLAREALEAVHAQGDHDAIGIVDEWQEFRDMVPAELSAVVHARNIVDGRNALDANVWREAGWTFRALGRP